MRLACHHITASNYNGMGFIFKPYHEGSLALGTEHHRCTAAFPFVQPGTNMKRSCHAHLIWLFDDDKDIIFVCLLFYF